MTSLFPWVKGDGTDQLSALPVVCLQSTEDKAPKDVEPI